MTTVTIAYTGTTYTLTDEGRDTPVLIDFSGKEWGPWEDVIDQRNEGSVIGAYRNQVTARAIASYAKDDHPHDADILDLLARFNAIKAHE